MTWQIRRQSNTAPCMEDPQWPSSRSEVKHINACGRLFILLNQRHPHALTSEPSVIDGPSVMLSSSLSCPSCLPPLTTSFICFLSVLCHNHSICLSSGRWGTVQVPKRGTHYPLSSSQDLTSEWKTVRNREKVCYRAERQWRMIRKEREILALSSLALLCPLDLE